MAISIPNRNDKIASQIRDSLRVLAWQEYKADYGKTDGELKGLELYQLFKDEWAKHEIQKMDLSKLQKLIADLGYSITDLTKIRGDYYRNKSNYNDNQNEGIVEEGLGASPF